MAKDIVKDIMDRVDANVVAMEQLQEERKSLRKVAKGLAEAGYLTTEDVQLVEEAFPTYRRKTEEQPAENI